MRFFRRWSAAAAVFAATFLGGCFALHPSDGGGQTSFTPPRQVNPVDVVLPAGYRIEAVTSGLTFPTGVAFDDSGGVYVVEAGYSYGEIFTTPRLLRIAADGGQEVVASGANTGPWTGIAFHAGNFFVAQGSQLEGGAILRIGGDGQLTKVVSGLPSLGDHHTNGPVVGSDGWLYFSQGTATNSAVVGPDNATFGWLRRFPAFHDIACQDIALTGENYETANPLATDGAKVRTGAFVPFGTPTASGQTIRGQLPCSGALMRVRPEGGPIELVAWGFRNPFGLAFAPDGRLYITDNSFDERGSRPVFGTGDLLWRVEPGAWYGWPDFHGDRPLYAGDRYTPYGGPPPKRLLAKHPGQPPRPVAWFPVHASANGFDFSRSAAFGHTGEAFVAQFGDEAPTTGKVVEPVGFRVVRVDVQSGIAHPFAVNRQGNGPASLLKSGGLERPVAARFDARGEALYVVDFGVLLHHGEGAVPQKGTGVLWRITREK
jgi:glucose/arabinose dehydrogenase